MICSSHVSSLGKAELRLESQSFASTINLILPSCHIAFGFSMTPARYWEHFKLPYGHGQACLNSWQSVMGASKTRSERSGQHNTRERHEAKVYEEGQKAAWRDNPHIRTTYRYLSPLQLRPSVGWEDCVPSQAQLAPLFYFSCWLEGNSEQNHIFSEYFSPSLCSSGKGHAMVLGMLQYLYISAFIQRQQITVQETTDNQ